MSDSITIANSNVVLFLQDFVSAVKNGFYMEDSNRGWPVAGLLKDVTLYKEPVGHVHSLNTYEDDTVVIAEYDFSRFLAEIQWAVKAGYELVEDTIYFESLKSIIVHKPVVSDVVEEESSEIREEPVEKKRPGRKAKK